MTDYGYRYVGIRPLDDDKTYVRSYHFVMPFTQIRPQQLGRAMGGGDRTNIAGHIWVPIDDENCMVWNWMYSFGAEGLERRRPHGARQRQRPRLCRDLGRVPLVPQQAQQLDDRPPGAEDTRPSPASTASTPRTARCRRGWGRSSTARKEHLGPADRAIIATRRLLLDAVKTVQAGGNPPGVDTSYYSARAIEKIFPRQETWRQTVLPEMYAEDLPVAAK